jgi:hypothetical protein
MRIILLLAAAGAAAIGTAASARPAARFTGSPGAWASAGGHRAGTGWQGRSRPGMSRDRRDGRHGGRPGRPGRDGLFVLDGGGIAGPTGIVAPYGDGFFAGGGGEVRLRGGRPHYDYDRSYPYEWASAAGRRPDLEEEARPDEPRPRCTLEHGVRVCRGW